MGIPNNMQITTHEHLMNDMAPDLTARLAGPPRLRSWEIDASFKCPVIGWCLDIAEQREILRKEGICVKDKSDFEAHGLLVESLMDENHISRRLDFWLNRKYKKELKKFSALAQGEFIEQWEASLKRGEIEGILWVAVTKADLSREARTRIFGDVHMEMHVRAAQIGKERQRFDKEKERSGILSRKLKEANRRTKTVRRENERLQEELSKKSRLYDDLARKNCELGKKLLRRSKESTISSLTKKHEALQEQGQKYVEKISSLETKLRNLQTRRRNLLVKLNKQRQINFLILKELEKPLGQLSASSRHAEQSLPLDLSQMRILIVGGLPKMELLYRRLIEESGGMFDYHDGHMRGGIKELDHQVRRADVVLCSIDYNSHAASLAVKRLGKKHGKSIRMLSNSSLSAISQALLEYQEGASIQ
jgi:DNA repair exonuclease SbcCD ATPase subunit